MIRLAHTVGRLVSAGAYVATAAGQVSIYFALVLLGALGRGPLARRPTA